MIGVVLCPEDPTQRHRFAVVTLAALAAGLGATVLRRVERVVVAGDSMRPTLAPGDRLVIVRGLRVRPGSLVAVHDPRPGADQVMVKRVASVGPSGLDVRGDDPDRSTDSRTFGPVPPHLVTGTVIWRYAPAARAGRPAPAARAGRPAPAAPGGNRAAPRR
jgi:nickel-type superoxide dismutase maturation protease